MSNLIYILRSILDALCSPSWSVCEQRGGAEASCRIIAHRDTLVLQRGSDAISSERYPLVSIFSRLGKGVDLKGSQNRVWFVSFAGHTLRCRSRQDALAIKRKADGICARVVKELDGKPLSALGDF